MEEWAQTYLLGTTQGSNVGREFDTATSATSPHSIRCQGMNTRCTSQGPLTQSDLSVMAIVGKVQ